VIYFARGTSTVRAPEQVYHNIIQYKTAEGAQLAMEMESPYVTVEYDIVDGSYDLGDMTIISKYREMQPSGEYRIQYLVETTYRNYQSRVGGWGWEKEFDLDYVIQIAEIAVSDGWHPEMNIAITIIIKVAKNVLFLKSDIPIFPPKRSFEWFT